MLVDTTLPLSPFWRELLRPPTEDELAIEDLKEPLERPKTKGTPSEEATMNLKDNENDADSENDIAAMAREGGS